MFSSIFIWVLEDPVRCFDNNESEGKIKAF